MAVPGAAHGPTGASVPRREGPGGRLRRARAAGAPASGGQCPRAPCSSKTIPISPIQGFSKFFNRSGPRFLYQSCAPEALGSFSQPV
jgi:hypothetical protein